MTELVFILDRSGSMSGLEADTIGGFNSMIEKQSGEGGDAFVTTVLFDGHTDIIHDRIPLTEGPKLTEKEYFARGSTALLDAVGSTICHIAQIHKYARCEDRPGKTLCVITTDGMENSSRAYSYDRVREMIAHQQEKHGWEFLFLGANIDAAAEAKRFGISGDHAADFICDSAEAAINYQAIECAVGSVRKGVSLDGDWKAGIDRDFRKRSKRK